MISWSQLVNSKTKTVLYSGGIMSDIETLARSNTAIAVAQTLANYTKASDRPIVANENTPLNTVANDVENIWRHAFDRQANTMQHNLDNVVLSEWVPRIPGLFWTPKASHLRMMGNWKKSSDGAYRVYEPGAKSAHVMGGVGTLRLGASPDGWRLCSVSALCQLDPEDARLSGPMSEQFVGWQANASSGLPLMVHNDVWAAASLEEGMVLELHGLSWAQIPASWGGSFPSIKDIPRGCLVLQQTKQATVKARNAPVAIHPFSVMQYDDPSGPRLDFVYAQGISSWNGWREEVASFFDWYKNQSSRYGEFLLGADLVDPLWDARYSTPAELQKAEKAGLNLLEARVVDPETSGLLIELLQRALIPALQDATPLNLIAAAAEIPKRWDNTGSLAHQVESLLDVARQTDHLPQLVDAVQVNLPDVLRNAVPIQQDHTNTSGNSWELARPFGSGRKATYGG
jgi:hypothetical protein